MNAFRLFIALFVLCTCGALPAFAGMEVQEITTKNGINAWLVEDHSLPVITISFAFTGAGSITDSPDKQGTAYMASIMMDEGAGDMDSQAFQAALQETAAQLSFSSSRDNFGGSLRTISANKKEAFYLLALALNNPRFDKDALMRMKKAAKSRIKESAANPNYLAARLLNDKAFEGYPYSQNSGGTLSTIDKISDKDLHSFVDTNLAQDNLVISVCGDISSKDLEIALDEIFSKLAKNSNIKTAGKIELQNTGKTFAFKYNTPQTIINIAMPSLPPISPDYFKLEVLNHIFGGGGFGSRLMSEIREKRGLSYGIYSSLSHLAQNDTLRIETSTKNESALQTADLVGDVMQSMKTHPITDKELTLARTHLIGVASLGLSSTSSIAKYLTSLQIQNLPHDYLEIRSSAIKALTVDDMAKFSEKFFNDNRSIIIMVGNPKLFPNDTIFVNEISGVE